LEKYGTARQIADDNTAHALLIQAKATHTHNVVVVVVLLLL
jgi:hypothetical protein